MSLYKLSNYVPVLFQSTYLREDTNRKEKCTWIQWRGKVLAAHHQDKGPNIV